MRPFFNSFFCTEGAHEETCFECREGFREG